MAEGYLKHFAGDKAEIYSAGIKAIGVNPNAIATMKEDGIDISNQTSNNVEQYKNIDFDFIITVCDNAKEKCPHFSSKAKKFHKNFPDPTDANQDEKTEKFRKTREMIKSYIENFVKENL